MSELESWRNPEMNSRSGAGDGGQGAGVQGWGYVGATHKTLRPMPQGAKLARDPAALPFPDASGNTRAKVGGPRLSPALTSFPAQLPVVPWAPHSHAVHGPVSSVHKAGPSEDNRGTGLTSVQLPQTWWSLMAELSPVTDGCIRGSRAPLSDQKGSKERLSEHPWEVSCAGASGQEGE